jgi:hypothetical protein
MKRVHFIGILSMVLILSLAMVSPAMAKPVDEGYSEVSNFNWITDTAGNHWLIHCEDYFSPSSYDYIYLEWYDADWNPIFFIAGTNSSYEYDFRINMNRGTATVKNLYVNLTATASGNSSDYTRAGSHKEGSWDTYYSGPGSVKGTITYGGNTYTFDYTSTDDFLALYDYHNIQK